MPGGYGNVVQGAYGEALVAAVASEAGLSVGQLRPDPGTDLVVESPETGELVSLQVKTESHPSYTADALQYELTVTAYDRLRCITTARRYLVVVAVPRTPRPRVSSMDWGYVMRRRAYFLSLRGCPSIDNQATITVSLPLCNLVSPASVRALVEGLTP